MDLVQLKKHSLTPAQFERLADVPPEEEWLANITNLKTRRAYKEDVREFIAFTGLQDYMRQALGAVLALRLSQRTQRCHRQSGGRSETANGQRERRQHPGTR